MRYEAVTRTDVGIRKKTNQDSAMILSANTDYGPAMLAMICDGMGGLDKGEVASATVIQAFAEWFKERLPRLIAKGITVDLIKSEWNNLILVYNDKLGLYGDNMGIKLGTTVCGLLIFKDIYYCINVGDSRAYEIGDAVRLLTKDQTFVQREIDLGHMTYEEAQRDPQRNVLLQCVGASDIVFPDYYIDKVKPNTCYMLCSDGFRHVITEEEMYDKLSPSVNTEREVMGDHVRELIELNMQRKEKDNITSILIRTYGEA